MHTDVPRGPRIPGRGFRRGLFVILAATALEATTPYVDHAWGSTIIGSSVTGVFDIAYFGAGAENAWDPSNGRVPSTGYVNSSGCGAPSCTVTISSSAPTFGYDDGNYLIVADFSSGNSLVITSEVLAGGVLVYSPLTMTFTDPVFNGASLQSDTFPNGLGFSFNGDEVTLTYGGFPSTISNASAVIAISSVPESSTWAMMLVGFAGLGFVGYRATAQRSQSRDFAASAI